MSDDMEVSLLTRLLSLTFHFSHVTTINAQERNKIQTDQENFVPGMTNLHRENLERSHREVEAPTGQGRATDRIPSQKRDLLRNIVKDNAYVGPSSS